MKYLSSLMFLLIATIVIYSQEWKHYPYTPENSLISFPEDEGRHPEEPTEWWYVFSHLKGDSTGNDYTFMLTYFYRDTLIFDGFRIFNISNESTGKLFSDVKPLKYITNSEDHLEIEANLQNHTETWVTKKDATGNLIPFEYKVKASSANTAIDFDMKVIKHPLILVDTGFLYQGRLNYTYYYSFTGIDISGELTVNGIKEKVSGIGWFDKQYGNFHPEVGEKYEWFSIQLSNGMDINTWNIFTTDNQLPQNDRYRLMNCYINDSSFYNTYKFDIKHKGYFYSPDGSRIYGKRYNIVDDSLNMNLNVFIQNPNCETIFPFPFYEGPISIYGTVAGQEVTGKGFAELLKFYEKPKLKLISPDEEWNYTKPIVWKLTNPDAGMPVFYDIFAINSNDNSIKYLAKNTTDTLLYIDTGTIKIDDAYKFFIAGRSIDSLLTDTISTPNYIKPNKQTDIYSDNIFIVSPNPFDDKLDIGFKSEKGDIKKIELYSSGGKKIIIKNIEKKSAGYSLTTVNLHSGTYFLTIYTKDNIFIKKIIKIK